MVLNNNLYKNNKIFIIAFLYSSVCFTAFLLYRGFGWDEDSFNSAAQFIKLINYDIYLTKTGSTVPKFLSIIFFGLNYLVFGNFYVLTFICIFFNSFMIAKLCEWIFDCGGDWLIALLGLTINLYYTTLVIGCNNPAFSLPLIFLGLFYYFHKRKKKTGMLLIFMSCLFRPGAEFIISFLLVYEIAVLFKILPKFYDKHYVNDKTENQIIEIQSITNTKTNNNWKNVSLLFIFSVLSVINLKWEYLLGFPTKEVYIQCCNLDSSNDYSFYAFVEFFKTIYKYVSKDIVSLMLIIPAFIGLIEIFRNKLNIRYVTISMLSYLVVFAILFIYNSVDMAYEPPQSIIIAIIIPVLSAFSNTNLSYLTKFRYKPVIMLLLLLFSILFLRISNEYNKDCTYQVNPDGTGIYNHYGCKVVNKIIKNDISEKHKFHALINENDRIFFVLDCGINAKEIELKDLRMNVQSVTLEDIKNDKFDVILLRPPVDKYFINEAKKMGYNSYFLKDKRYLFTKKTTK